MPLPLLPVVLGALAGALVVEKVSEGGPPEPDPDEERRRILEQAVDEAVPELREALRELVSAAEKLMAGRMRDAVREATGWLHWLEEALEFLPANDRTREIMEWRSRIDARLGPYVEVLETAIVQRNRTLAVHQARRLDEEVSLPMARILALLEQELQTPTLTSKGLPAPPETEIELPMGIKTVPELLSKPFPKLMAELGAKVSYIAAFCSELWVDETDQPDEENPIPWFARWGNYEERPERKLEHLHADLRDQFEEIRDLLQEQLESERYPSSYAAKVAEYVALGILSRDDVPRYDTHSIYVIDQRNAIAMMVDKGYHPDLAERLVHWVDGYDRDWSERVAEYKSAEQLFAHYRRVADHLRGLVPDGRLGPIAAYVATDWFLEPPHRHLYSSGPGRGSRGTWGPERWYDSEAGRAWKGKYEYALIKAGVGPVFARGWAEQLADDRIHGDWVGFYDKLPEGFPEL
jgi:hypothetical protein